MKRVGNLFESVCDLENLKLADKNARKGKLKQYGVIKHTKNEEQNLIKLRESLLLETFKTSEYKDFEIIYPKKRIISRLPYYPDRIVHHSLALVLKPIFYKLFTADTYSCIEGRGVRKASYKLRKSLLDKEGTKYCLKIDIKQFYPSVNNNILKELLRRKLKDEKVLKLLFEIIDSKEGLPLGNYLSQLLSNFYLSYFDHFVKEQLKVKYYFRYADDMIFLSDNKEDLHRIFKDAQEYLTSLKLEIKSNYRVFPTNLGIDFVGFVHFHDYVKLRKSIKQNYKKSSNKKNWNGWLVHCNSKNLRRKYEDS